MVIRCQSYETTKTNFSSYSNAIATFLQLVAQGNMVVIYSTVPNETAIEIYDELGKQMNAYTENAQKGLNVHEFGVKDLSKGIFILKVTFDEITNEQKFMVE